MIKFMPPKPGPEYWFENEMPIKKESAEKEEFMIPLHKLNHPYMVGVPELVFVNTDNICWFGRVAESSDWPEHTKIYFSNDQMIAVTERPDIIVDGMRNLKGKK